MVMVVAFGRRERLGSQKLVGGRLSARRAGSLEGHCHRDGKREQVVAVVVASAILVECCIHERVAGGRAELCCASHGHAHIAARHLILLHRKQVAGGRVGDSAHQLGLDRTSVRRVTGAAGSAIASLGLACRRTASASQAASTSTAAASVATCWLDQFAVFALTFTFVAMILEPDFHLFHQRLYQTVSQYVLSL